MNLHALKWKDLPQTLNPDLPLTLLTLTVLGVLVPKVGLLCSKEVQLSNTAPNFWRFCHIDKTNMVVSKNRLCKEKMLRQGFYFLGLLYLIFFCVYLMCYVLLFSVNFFTRGWLFHNFSDCGFRLFLSSIFRACLYLCTLNLW